MSPIALSAELARLMDVFGFSAGELADVLDTDKRTVYRWFAGDTYPQHESRALLNALGELEQRLTEAFGSREATRLWLHSESGYFGGLRPLDALLRGRIDAVHAALEALDAGVFV